MHYIILNALIEKSFSVWIIAPDMLPFTLVLALSSVCNSKWKCLLLGTKKNWKPAHASHWSFTHQQTFFIIVLHTLIILAQRMHWCIGCATWIKSTVVVACNVFSQKIFLHPFMLWNLFSSPFHPILSIHVVTYCSFFCHHPWIDKRYGPWYAWTT